ncbi:MAG: nuclear transport factor 2 family protein, partial [Gammaproteobacteria bacterium]|nr:nuclear transport factor 2 family protein [Gammaproteobacteria bacterium]
GQINDLVVRAINIIRSHNFMPYFDLFTDDALWMMPNNFKDVGKEEARKFYRFTEKFWFDQQISIDEMLVVDSLAFVRLTFDGFLRAKTDPDAAPVRSVSRHIWVIRKDRTGQWKIFRDIWNNPRKDQSGNSKTNGIS